MRQEHSCKAHPSLNQLEVYLKTMVKGPKINSESLLNLPKILEALLMVKRDLPALLMEDNLELDLMVLTIEILQMIEDQFYIFQEYPQLILEITTCLMLKDCSQQLLINSLSFRAVVKKCIQDYLVSQIKYNPLCDTLFILLVSMCAHFDFIEHPDLEMMLELITCFQFSTDQAKKIVDANKTLSENIRLHSKNKRLLQDLEKQPKPEELFNQVPKDAHDILVIGLALLPQSVCEMSPRQKFRIYTDLLKTTNIDIFQLLFALKIIQTLLPNFHRSELMGEQEILHKLIDLARSHEFFIQPRECMRTINQLLVGYDDTLIWIKFDSENFFDNSNQHNVLIHGDPEKLQFEQGLFFDGCGCSFDLGSALELEQPLQMEESITISFWMVMFSPENNRARSQSIDFAIRTLICNSDGITPLIFTDTFSQLFGITNQKEGDVGLKFFSQKDSNKTYQGWNHIAIILDNIEETAYLYLNGQLESSIQKVKCKLEAKYIGNSGSLKQPFGYVCDLRIYNKVVPEKSIKILGHYDKHQVMLKNNDIYSKFLEDQTLGEFKKLLSEYQSKYGETCAQILQTFAKLCQSGTIMRLECAKLNMFDQISLLIYNSNPQIQYWAAKAINNMK